MALFDWLFTDTSKAQTPAEADANYARLQAQLESQGTPLGANAGTLEDPGTAAASTFFQNLNPFASDSNAPAAPGLSSLVKDVLVLAAIAGAIYLFVKLGGIKQVHKLVS
jgi:hypothetical protein